MTTPMNKGFAMLFINDLLLNKNLEIYAIDESRPSDPPFDLILRVNCKYRIDETDVWRENLKAWTLNRAEKKPTFTLSIGAVEGVSIENMVKSQADRLIKFQDVLCETPYITGEPKELFTDDLQIIDSHYKGEF